MPRKRRTKQVQVLPSIEEEMVTEGYLKTEEDHKVDLGEGAFPTAAVAKERAAHPFAKTYELSSVRPSSERNRQSKKLYLAVDRGDKREVEFLLISGAEVDFLSPEHGSTPLATAARNRDLAMVKTLLTYGASVNLQDAAGNTPLDFSIAARDFDSVRNDPERKKTNREISKLLISYGGRINYGQNKTPRNLRYISALKESLERKDRSRVSSTSWEDRESSRKAKREGKGKGSGCCVIS
ncbi:MAG: ankyrin repeat domain-containing protein [Rickettsiales bacterium]